MILNEVDSSLKVEWSQRDKDQIHKGLQLGKISGSAHSIVVAERVVLNFMQRMSGIATLTKVMADVAYPAIILETRKTAPGLRLVDKWAVWISSLIESTSLGTCDLCIFFIDGLSLRC
ncbi:Quinolinate phosphoribosyltransferase [decarboxylating] 1a [Dionaea muscipula]